VSTRDPAELYVYLTTTGRNSGLPRQIEIWYVERAGLIYILAEHGARAQWVRNILANPAVRLRIGNNTWEATGRVLDADKDQELYSAVREMAKAKYGWGDGLPVEFCPAAPLR
jgi:deazaflavin-dependent oxidoreductase (nitroreductase family)